MAKPFLPTRPWQWAMVPLLLLIFVTVLFPPFAYSGPGPLTHRRVAYYIQKTHDYGQGWPQSRADLKVWSVRSGDPPYDLTLRGATPHAALYRIAVGGKEELWRVDETKRPARLVVE